MSKKLFILLCLCFVFSLSAFAQEEYGDAPEGVLAYPSLGVNGQFPTCKTVGPAGWIQHTNFGAWFGPAFELELDGNAGACPGFAPYDLDECFADGDAGLLVPDSYTIVAGAVALCPNSAGIPLGNTCQTAVWGGNIDIDVINNMPNNTDGLVNVIIDWDQNGQWAGASTCPPAVPVPEHVLQNFLVPNGYAGPLSGLGPPPFVIGPNSGFVWVRFTISEQAVGLPWDGSGSFEDGESEDYLLRIDPSQSDELDFGDAPDNALGTGPGDYQTVLADNGARHIITAGGPFFDDGSGTDTPDTEPDGQQDPQALGDDNDGNDDEDGVVVPPLVIGQTVTITFDVGGPGGGVEAFIDWNADGDWTDAGEALPSASYGPGPASMNVTVPASAVVGPTFARFRISQAGPFPMTEVGQAQDGEVEDHEVFIEEEQEPEEKLKFQQLPLDGVTIGLTTYWGHDELSTAYNSTDLLVISEGCYMADDFADLEHSPVTRVKWWGSYLENEIIQQVDRFLIAFETDIPAQGHPDDVDYIPSHPGDVLLSQIVVRDVDGILATGEFSEANVSTGGPPCNEALYEYEAILETPFGQDPNTVYWLKIVAIIDDPSAWGPLSAAAQNYGLGLCEFLRLPYADQAQYGLQQPVTRWGWHNRDYTQVNPYAATPPAVNPGEHNPRVYIPTLPAIPGLADTDVWHFQDDAVFGDIAIDASDPSAPGINQPTWQEEFYKFFLPYCTTTQGIDGPDEISAYSEDLAFELWTPTDCVKSTASFYADWVLFGKPACWCYQR
ncbi:MAG: DUF7901 domain-containing protein, partial [Planctomycetota bacterium]